MAPPVARQRRPCMDRSDHRDCRLTAAEAVALAADPTLAQSFSTRGLVIVGVAPLLRLRSLQQASGAGRRHPALGPVAREVTAALRIQMAGQSRLFSKLQFCTAQGRHLQKGSGCGDTPRTKPSCLTTGLVQRNDYERAIREGCSCVSGFVFQGEGRVRAAAARHLCQRTGSCPDPVRIPGDGNGVSIRCRGRTATAGTRETDPALPVLCRVDQRRDDDQVAGGTTDRDRGVVGRTASRRTVRACGAPCATSRVRRRLRCAGQSRRTRGTGGADRTGCPVSSGSARRTISPGRTRGAGRTGRPPQCLIKQ